MQDLIAKAAAVMEASAEAVMAVVDEDGFPRASMISSIKTKGIAQAWFATSLTSGKIRCLRHNKKAGLCYRDKNNNITLMGTVEILTEPKIKEELWLPWFIRHFPGGVTDPNYCILAFSAEKAVLWLDLEYVELDVNCQEDA